jgi:predicted site-specific integrase-resolvase
MTDQSTVGILDEYLNDNECAAELNVAPITLARWRREKKGPPVTYMGRRILYKKSSVKTWLAAQERPTERHSPNRKSVTA